MLYILTAAISVAVLSILLIFFIFIRLADINKFFKNSHYQRTAEGFSDLLQYDCLIEENIILLKNGSLLTAFYYEGIDMSQIPLDEQEMMTNLISKAIFELGTGWTINFDAVRVETAKYSDRAFSSFPDEISFAIDEERRKFFNSKDTMYATTNFITLTYTPPLEVQTKFIDMMYTESEKNKTLTVAEKNLIYFKSKLDNFFPYYLLFLKSIGWVILTMYRKTVPAA